MAPQKSKGRAAGTRATPKENKEQANATSSNCLACLRPIEAPPAIGMFPSGKTFKNGAELILRYEICRYCADMMRTAPADYEQWMVRLHITLEPVAAMMIAGREAEA